MEAVVALAVFAVGMLGLGGTFAQIVHANTASRQKQMAALLAESKLSQFRTVTAGEWTQTAGTFEMPFNDYEWEARFFAQSRDLGVTDVCVEVVHRSGAGVRLWSQIVGPDDR
jgi:Tfp pilus assembly protein PilV